MPKTPVIRVTENYGADRRHDESRKTTDIYVQDNGLLTRRYIQVYARFEHLENTWEPAEVNWSAFGSVTPEETAEFAKALTWASREASRIDKKNGIAKKATR